jgi:hypothetical protein
MKDLIFMTSLDEDFIRIYPEKFNPNVVYDINEKLLTPAIHTKNLIENLKTALGKNDEVYFITASPISAVGVSHGLKYDDARFSYCFIKNQINYYTTSTTFNYILSKFFLTITGNSGTKPEDAFIINEWYPFNTKEEWNKKMGPTLWEDVKK